MKKITTIILSCLLMATFAKAQYATIPDANFRAYLKSIIPGAFNSSSQMDTSNSSVKTLNAIYCNGRSIKSIIGIQYFKNLQSLYCYNNQIATISNLPAGIITLNCNNNQLTSITSFPSKLTSLDCGYNLLTSLPTLSNSLYSLICNDNKLTSLPSFPASLSTLNCSNNKITSLPALNMNYLFNVNCRNNLLTSLPTQFSSYLQILDCGRNNLTSLPASLDSTFLYNLNCDSNQLTSLPSLSSNLQSLSCKSNKITTLSAYAGLTNLNCDYNLLTSLPSLNNISTLTCSNNPNLTCLPTLMGSLTTLDVSNTQVTCLPNAVVGLNITPVGLGVCSTTNTNNCPISNPFVNIPDSNFRQFLISKYPTCFNSSQLLDTTCKYVIQEYNINCNNHQIRDLTGIEYFKRLGSLSCDSNLLSSLTSIPNGLWSFSCNNNLITSLPNFPRSLGDISCKNNLLTSLPPLTNLWGLYSLNCDSNQLTSLPPFHSDTLKNYYDSMSYLSVNGNPNLTCLPRLPLMLRQLDVRNTQIACIPNTNAWLTTLPANLPICSQINNANQCLSYPTVYGYIYGDNNMNGIKDTNENYLPYVPVSLGHGIVSYTDNTGKFSISTDSLGTYSLKTILNNAYYKSVPDSSVFSFSSYNNTLTIPDIAIQPVVIKDSLAIDYFNWWGAVPGRKFVYEVYYRNEGTTNLATDLSFTYDTSKLIFDSAYIPVTHNGNTISWHDSLMANYYGYYYYNYAGSHKWPFFYFTVKTNAQLGDVITSNATINATNSSASASAVISNVVRSSYDPNDKQATPKLTPTQVVNGNYIDYTIHFQNVGNASANNIVIADTLSQLLNHNIVQIVGSSHNQITDIANGIIYFKFLNINLPDSNTNESKSHGFIKFRLKPINTVSLGSNIDNKASIYFDYNSPVVTNTARTNINTSNLPIRLINYNVNAVKDNYAYIIKIRNNWVTAEEINTSYFIVQRSTNGKDFINAGKVKAIGGGMYEFDDKVENTSLHTLYYRLMIVDNDGKINYSDVKSIVLKTDKFTSIDIYPNPAKNFINVEGNNISLIRIMDNAGKIVLSRTGSNKLNEQIKIPFNLSKGIYLTQIISSDGTVTNNKLMVE